MQGSKLINENEIKISSGANVISLRTLLVTRIGNNYPLEGSFEFEIHSEKNLFFSYPAAVVRYIGTNWHSIAHTTQRIYSELSGDSNELMHSSFRAEEGNQTIPSETWFEPFFIIHNGLDKITDEDMEIEIQSINQSLRSYKIPRIKWASRETKVFWLKDLCNYRLITGGGIGTYTVKFKVKGVFPRIIAGIEDTRNGAWSIDHTNFAAKSGPAVEDVFEVSPKSKNNLVFVMPNLAQESWNSFADIYPTGPAGNFSVDVNEDGRNTAIKLTEGNKRLMRRVKLHNSKSTTFSFQNKDGFLPKRFHMGLHYQFKDGAPGFLIDGPLPISAKPVSTRWSPIFSGQKFENYILLSDRKLGDKEFTGFTAEIAFYNAAGNDPLRRNLEVNPGDTLVFSIEQDEQLKDFISGGPAWAYMKFQPASYAVVHYLSRLGNSIATCHAF